MNSFYIHCLCAVYKSVSQIVIELKWLKAYVCKAYNGRDKHLVILKPLSVVLLYWVSLVENDCWVSKWFKTKSSLDSDEMCKL